MKTQELRKTEGTRKKDEAVVKAGDGLIQEKTERTK
jgi:hypothetical protein